MPMNSLTMAQSPFLKSSDLMYTSEYLPAVHHDSLKASFKSDKRSQHGIEQQLSLGW